MGADSLAPPQAAVSNSKFSLAGRVGCEPVKISQPKAWCPFPGSRFVRRFAQIPSR